MNVTSEPETMADVREYGVYRLAVAARLLGMSVVTFKKYAQADGLIRPTPSAWIRVLGREILRVAGQREVDRAACTVTGDRVYRDGRSDASVARLLAATGGAKVKAK